MKGGVAAMVIAAESLAEAGVALAGDLVVNTVTDEESTGAGGLVTARTVRPRTPPSSPNRAVSPSGSRAVARCCRRSPWRAVPGMRACAPRHPDGGQACECDREGDIRHRGSARAPGGVGAGSCASVSLAARHRPDDDQGGEWLVSYPARCRLDCHVEYCPRPGRRGRLGQRRRGRDRGLDRGCGGGRPVARQRPPTVSGWWAVSRLPEVANDDPVVHALLEAERDLGRAPGSVASTTGTMEPRSSSRVAFRRSATDLETCTSPTPPTSECRSRPRRLRPGNRPRGYAVLPTCPSESVPPRPKWAVVPFLTAVRSEGCGSRPYRKRCASTSRRQPDPGGSRRAVGRDGRSLLPVVHGGDGRAGAGERRSGVVIDVAGLTFIDSSGINALVQAARAVEARGGRAVLAAHQGRTCSACSTSPTSRRSSPTSSDRDEAAAAVHRCDGRGRKRSRTSHDARRRRRAASEGPAAASTPCSAGGASTFRRRIAASALAAAVLLVVLGTFFAWRQYDDGKRRGARTRCSPRRARLDRLRHVLRRAASRP